MRKVLKSFAGIVLACAIAFTAVPQTAHAVAYSADKLNISANAGGSYTIKTYFPGIGYQKMKVSFTSINKEQKYEYAYYDRASRTTYYYPYIRNSISIRCSLPKSTQNKIKHNAVKIVRSSKHRFDGLMCGACLIDAETGCSFNNSNMTNKLRYATSYSHDRTSKTFVQRSGWYRARYTVDTAWTTDMTVDVWNSYQGKVLVGIAGAAKDISRYNSKVTNFTNGATPITSSPFFKKKMKKLSIFTRL